MGRRSYTQKRVVYGSWRVFVRATLWGLLVWEWMGKGLGCGVVFGATARVAAWLLRFALQIAVVDISVQYCGYGLGVCHYGTGGCVYCVYGLSVERER